MKKCRRHITIKLSASMVMVVYIAAAFAVIVIMVVLFPIYKTLCKYVVTDNNSHTNSSVLVGLGNAQGLIEFSLEELKKATNDFGENNFIGKGTFGQVYIGLIRNTIVAIKMLSGSPRFLSEVITDLSKIRHCNVVNLFGYCGENGYQMLIYEYLVNGNMRDYLHDSIDLRFKERIYIALGAAKGLQHLHSLSPPLAHNRFNTAKVLLDADLNAKVSDVGLLRLVDVHDLEVGLEQLERFDETGDVYGFGLFLLEVLTGEEPKGLVSIEELVQWIDPRICSNTFVDKRMNETFTSESLEGVMRITLKCLRFPGTRRPKMEEIVTELEKILIDEEHSTRFTLGSELFTMTA